MHVYRWNVHRKPPFNVLRRIELFRHRFTGWKSESLALFLAKLLDSWALRQVPQKHKWEAWSRCEAGTMLWCSITLSSSLFSYHNLIFFLMPKCLSVLILYELMFVCIGKHDFSILRHVIHYVYCGLCSSWCPYNMFLFICYCKRQYTMMAVAHLQEVLLSNCSYKRWETLTFHVITLHYMKH